MSDDFLVCAGLSKYFGAVAAVESLDLTLARGRLLALLGPSGCGKTTLLRLIAGFETPTQGRITLAGREISAPSVLVAPERRRVAMVFQDFALFPHLNVGANVRFGLPRGTDKKRRTAELLALVGLEGLEARMPHQLSGGQQQRVALARALAAEPELILLDEPFSNLDPSIRARVRQEVKQLIQAVGITALFVTHDQDEALSLAEAVGVMIGGRLLQVGPPIEIYTRPASRAVGEFVGGANFLSGEVKDAVAQCELGSFRVAADFSGPADVMLRSESLTLAENGLSASVERVAYYGHDQLITVRLQSGTPLDVRLPAAQHFLAGQRVGVAVRGDVFAFPRAAS